MASFGVILRSGRPYSLPTAPGAAGRLHFTQVSLDDGPGENTVTVCCTVGKKVPIIIARLLPNRAESLQLDLRYNLSEEATFSVLGPRKVHLAGFFDGLDGSADSESFGEDVAQTESEKTVDDEDKYGGSFINDSDPGYSSFSSELKLSFKERSIDDGNKGELNGKNHSRGRLRKVGQIVSSSDSSGQSEGNETNTKAVVLDSGSDIEFYENSLLRRKLPTNGSVKGAQQKNMSSCQNLTTKSVQGIDSAKQLVPDTEGLIVSSLTKQSAKKKESKKRLKDANPENLQADKTMEGELKQNIASKSAHSLQMKVKKATEPQAKKKKYEKENPTQNVNEHIPDTAVALPEKVKDKSKKEKSDKYKKKRKRSESSNNAAETVNTEARVWTSSNGVIIEELVRGNLDGKIALPGKKISIHYVVKSKGSNDFTTPSNSSLKFRLGAQDAIAGWNEGLEGVRTGDKRRLIVSAPQSPENDSIGSQMVYDIEVLRVY